MAHGVRDEHRVFLSLLPASGREKRLALIVVGVSFVVFAAIAPFAKTPLPRIDGFIPSYQAPLAVNDLLTAILLFGQYSITRSRGLLYLASAYLFTALLVSIHLASFPGAFAETGLFGAGPQTTAWLYMIWHAGFPLLVVAYALTGRSNGIIRLRDHRDPPPARHAIVKCVALVIAAAGAALVLTTSGHEMLPPVMAGNTATPTLIGFVTVIWLGSLGALFLLWQRKPHSVLDLWLMVALCTWLTDIALGAMLNAGRFDLGFYAGRVYGLIAASLVLIVLLLETRKLYSQLARSLDAERAEAEKGRAATELANLALRDSERRLQQLNETLEQRVNERSRQLEAEVTAHARAQDALREAQKLEAIGRMAGGIAHDFNNLLTIVLGNAELLQSADKSPADIQAAKAIERASYHGVQLIRQILAFSRKQSLNPEVIDLRARATALSQTLSRTVRGDIHVMVNMPDDLWAVECDTAELELALMNLCVNARDASAAGELVSITGANATFTGAEASGDRVLLSSPHEAGDFVAIAVADSGSGIAAEDLRHVFEPFFTTKEVGRGTGLGLSQVYGFAQQAGGRVAIESERGKGTVVTIYLPRATTAAAPAKDAGAERPLGRGTILLIEDDPQVAATALKMLAAIGYDAQHVMDARSALALLLGGRRFDLLFSDIVMPGGMDGIALSRKVRQHFPAQPILLATGYSRAAADVQRDGFAFIAKPYRLDSLAQAIVEAIGRRDEDAQTIG